MMQPQMNTSSAVPITSTAGIPNFDHFKYVRSLLPSVPHVIESLSFTDLNNWECQICANLLNESDCTKWLTNFEEKTNTHWKVDKDASRVVSQTHKAKGCVWQMIYKLDSRKDCPGKLEMRLFGHDETERNRPGKQYPCQVNINYYTNQNTATNTILNMESFKSQDIPSHIKEGFEGYFHSDLQPLTQTTTISLQDLKPHPPSMLNSPLTHTFANNHQSSPPILVKAEGNLDGKLVTAARTNGQAQQALVDITDVSQELDNTFEVLGRMMKESGSAAIAVKSFVDMFKKLQGDQTQLENALTTFGVQWDILLSGNEAGVSLSQAPPQMTLAPVSTTPLPQQQPQVHSPSQDLSPKKKAKKTKLKLDEKEVNALASTPQSVFSPIGGQILLQPPAVTPGQPQTQAPTSNMDSDAKKRKRARCGTCSGCLNSRDKTQDCRTCRNCLDQKRYGGPGKLKKACIKRQCQLITQMTLADSAPSEAKTEPPVFSVKTDPAPVTSQASVPLLSWPSGAYTPTFQVQVPQQVQFSLQPMTYSSGAGVTTNSQAATLQGLQPLQYTTAVPSQTLQPALTASQLGAV